MSKMISVLIVFSLYFTETKSQEHYLRVHEFGETVKPLTMKAINGRFFVFSSKICNNVECTVMHEISEYGEILNEVEIPDIDIATETVRIINDTFYITGNTPANIGFRLKKYSIDGEKLGETIQINHPTRSFERMFQLTTEYWQDKLFVGGRGIENDSMRSLIYIIRLDGILDTLIELEISDLGSRLWDSYIDNQNRLTTFHQITNIDQSQNRIKVIKFDTELDTVWSYESEGDSQNKTVPFASMWPGGKDAYVSYSPTNPEKIREIRIIDEEGDLTNQFSFFGNQYSERFISRMKVLSNGDIIGCGKYAQIEEEPRIDNSPWLFRMTQEGEVLWSRVYYDIDENINQSRIGRTYDMTELDNGDIMAIGYTSYDNSSLFVLRVGADGCLEDIECNEQTVVTHTLEEKTTFNISITPNPIINNNIRVNLLQNHCIDCHFEVYNWSGQLITSSISIHGENNIPFDYPAGAYILIAKQEGIPYFSQKFIKP